MTLIDWLIVVIYFILTIGLEILLSRKASKSMEDFFVSGRIAFFVAGGD